MKILDHVSQIEENDHFHEARLLLLISGFKDDPEGLRGLTKLAKLDFLMRYPVCLERALKKRGKSTKNLKILDHERFSVESTMIRYKFGPWDFKYKRILHLLSAKGLITIARDGSAIVLRATDSGAKLADSIAATAQFMESAKRAHLVRTNFDLTPKNLVNFIYTTFPEVVSLSLGEKITNAL